MKYQMIQKMIIKKEKYNPYVKPKQVEDEKNKVEEKDDEQEEDIIERLFRRLLN